MKMFIILAVILIALVCAMCEGCSTRESVGFHDNTADPQLGSALTYEVKF